MPAGLAAFGGRDVGTAGFDAAFAGRLAARALGVAFFAAVFAADLRVVFPTFAVLTGAFFFDFFAARAVTLAADFRAFLPTAGFALPAFLPLRMFLAVAFLATFLALRFAVFFLRAFAIRLSFKRLESAADYSVRNNKRRRPE